LYADASLRLGAVLGYLGRTAESQAILALAVALDPERPITLAEFSPDVVAAVDAVRAQTRPTRSVRIASSPAGAAISVDGKELGRAPLHADLGIGQHVVVARVAQYQARALAVAVDDSTSEVEVELEADVGWARLAEGAMIGATDARAQELVDAASRFADLDEVVLVADSEQRGGPTLLVQRCAGLPARCTAVIEIGYADRSGMTAAAREAWQAARAADLRYPPSVFGDPRATGKRGGAGCKLCRSPILWGGVGVAAVVATVAIIAIVSSSRPPPVVGVDQTQF
ncbi:MAG TPA: PEGA domain-containing protein, partial [Kofleriaceae bacterium]